MVGRGRKNERVRFERRHGKEERDKSEKVSKSSREAPFESGCGAGSTMGRSASPPALSAGKALSSFARCCCCSCFFFFRGLRGPCCSLRAGRQSRAIPRFDGTHLGPSVTLPGRQTSPDRPLTPSLHTAAPNNQRVGTAPLTYLIDRSPPSRACPGCLGGSTLKWCHSSKLVLGRPRSWRLLVNSQCVGGVTSSSGK